MTGSGEGDGWWRSPAAGLAAVIGLIYLNQVLFTVYVVREHGGDPSFIARHVPDGWFSLARGAVVESLARSFPAPALLVVAAARAAAPRVPDRPPPGRGVCSIARSTGWLLVLALVPALPIRYGLGFGAPYLSVAGALVLVVVAAELGRREAFAEVPGGPPGRWLLQMVAAGLAGLCGAATALLVDADHTETRLLAAGAAGLLAAVSVCAYLDRRASDRRESQSGDPAGRHPAAVRS